MARRLNLGCGKEILSGWDNLDRVAMEGVQFVHDLNQHPLPFPDAHYEEVVCQNVLEHVDYLQLLREIHRILIPGGCVRIQVPHFTSRNNFDDPTHIHQFSLTTFTFFLKSHPRSYYFDFAFSEIRDMKLHFEKSKFLLYNHVAEWLFPLLPAPRFLYEGSFLRNLLPAESIFLTMVK